MSINRVSISGNLTRDAEVRTTSSGMAVAKFGVAVNERVKRGDQWEDSPNFFDCTMFGRRAESIGQYLLKGTKVAIDGKLRWSQWEKDGEKRSKVEIIAEEIEFMSSKGASQQAEPEYVQATVYGADIPF